VSTCAAADLVLNASAADHEGMALRRSLLSLAILFAALMGITAPVAVAETRHGVESSEPPESSSAAGPDWIWPLSPAPSVVNTFDLPEETWLAGHRGVDLLGETGQVVSAIGDGEVTFASNLAGRGVIVVTHGSLRSTYEPVTSGVQVGQRVSAGEPIGSLQAPRSHCAPRVCLHLGVRRGEVYLDPLSLLGPLEVRLKPLGFSPEELPAAHAPSIRRGHRSAAKGSRDGAGTRNPSGQLPSASTKAPDSAGAGSWKSDAGTLLLGGGAAGAAIATWIGIRRRVQARG
jgi:hypothetical protein